MWQRRKEWPSWSFSEETCHCGKDGFSKQEQFINSGVAFKYLSVTYLLSYSVVLFTIIHRRFFFPPAALESGFKALGLLFKAKEYIRMMCYVLLKSLNQNRMVHFILKCMTWRNLILVGDFIWLFVPYRMNMFWNCLQFPQNTDIPGSGSLVPELLWSLLTMRWE